MPDTVTLQDTRYSLAEAAILSAPWLSPATSPDVLARPAVVAFGVDSPLPTLRKVVIRRSGPETIVEVQASRPMPRSFLKSVERVVDLLSLPAGWNSYSAKPIDPRNVVRAIRLLAELLGAQTPPPIVVPTVKGGIQLEWHTKGVNIEAYVDSPESVSFFAEQAGSDQSLEQPLDGHEHELKQWLARISEG